MKALTKESLAETGTSRDFHLGALQFFSEKGVKVGW